MPQSFDKVPMLLENESENVMDGTGCLGVLFLGTTNCNFMQSVNFA